MFHTSYIELSKSAYRKNIKYLRNVIGKEVRLSSVIKGNAYGHGMEHIISMAEEYGIDHFSVFSASEAFDALKYKSESSGLMIMGLLDYEEIEWAIKNDIEFFVYEPGKLEKSINIAKALQKKARLHVEVETGFHRTGFEYKYMPTLIEYMKENKEHFIFEGLCTHYAGAESISNYVRVKNQIKKFHKFSRYFQRHELIPLRKHTASSAATLTYPQTIMDMVRIGIAQFGFWPSPETHMYRFRKNPKESYLLQRVLSWKSRIMVVKEVEPGEFIGYGTSFLANKKMKISVIPVGYANGFSRVFSNTGRVLIRGRRVPVIGTVTMNTTTVNVSDLPHVEKNDEVVFIGKQRKLSISVASFCQMSEQLNYQLLARLPANIPRYIVK